MTSNLEKRAELVDHLTELRTRIVRCALYVVVGAIAAWFLYEPFIFKLLTRPMEPLIRASDSKVQKFMFTSIMQPFMLRLQVCMIGGLILVLPAVTAEIWGFVAPGLRSNEKKPLRWVVPLSVLLFALGVLVAYTVMPWGFQWFSNYVPTNAEIRPSVQETMRFVMLMLLAFGVVFELPVFLMLLGYVGVIDSQTLKRNWRYWVVGISVAAAMFCPSGDVLSMLAMAIPLVILYFASILLVRLVERKRGKT